MMVQGAGVALVDHPAAHGNAGAMDAVRIARA
jgi:hypothetical protein